MIVNVVCIKGKQCRLPFKNIGTGVNKLLELVHADLCGPIEEVSIGGSRYVLVIVDDSSRKVFIYFVKSKSEVDKFSEFKSYAEKSTNQEIKVLRTDNGSEFYNERMRLICKQPGIKHPTKI